MITKIYPERHTYLRYDKERVICYLNEQETSYTPEGADNPITGYSYTGTEEDGGTLIKCLSGQENRDSLIDGIIRTRFEFTEQAIKTHQIMLLQNPQHENAEAYAAEWAEFNAFRDAAIATVDGWFAE